MLNLSKASLMIIALGIASATIGCASDRMNTSRGASTASDIDSLSATQAANELSTDGDADSDSGSGAGSGGESSTD